MALLLEWICLYVKIPFSYGRKGSDVDGKLCLLESRLFQEMITHSQHIEAIVSHAVIEHFLEFP